jgi:acyl-coenzyme A synthetase/AMP-(fatty) acid ligase
VAFALENESGGLYMAAALIPRAGNIDMKKLGAYAEQETGFAAPKSFFIMRDFPRNPSGKLLRAEVTALAKKMLAESRKT